MYVRVYMYVYVCAYVRVYMYVYACMCGVCVCVSVCAQLTVYVSIRLDAA